MSFRPHGTATLPLDGFSRSLIFETIFFFWKICRQKSRFNQIWQEYQVLYMRTYVPVWKHLAECFLKCFTQKLKRKSYTFYVQYRFSENRAVYEITWKNIVEPGRPHDSITKHMRITRWITNATYTHSGYVTLIIVKSSRKYFLVPQQWKENPLLHLQGNNEHLQSAQNCICVSSNKQGRYWRMVLLCFHGNSGYANAPQCTPNVVRTLPVFFIVYRLLPPPCTDNVESEHGPKS